MPSLKVWGFRWRGLVGALLLFPAFAVVLFSEPLVVEGSWAAFLLDAPGWFAFVAGAVFRFWPTIYIGGRKRTVLMSDGPYSICRNPLYLGSLLLSISMGFFLHSVVFGTVVGVAMVFYLASTIPAEERDLRSVLGAPYEVYCRRVPRLWPRFSLFRTEAVIEVKVKGLRLEARRGMLWMFIPLGGLLAANLRAHSWWPHWFNLL